MALKRLASEYREIERQNKALDNWCILSMFRGSIAHGMYNPESIDDVDVVAVCVPPLEHYLGVVPSFSRKGTREIREGKWDIVIHETQKLFNLLLKSNPNVLGMLWTKRKYWLKVTPAGQLLIDNRDVFVGKHAFSAFKGYAWSQFDRMMKGAYRGYMGEKRKEMVRRVGYDAKNAAHLIRLLRMGVEFLTMGRMMVERPDAEELLAIKRGEWSLEGVKVEANHWFSLLDDALAASRLPDKPDREKVHELCVKAIETRLWGEKNVES